MTEAVRGLRGYPWAEGGLGCAHEYLLPELEVILDDYAERLPGLRALDLGCGNGAVTGWLADRRGIEQVVGVEQSEEGIDRPRAAHPELELHQLSAYAPSGLSSERSRWWCLSRAWRPFTTRARSPTPWMTCTTPGARRPLHSLPWLGQERGDRASGPIR